MNEMMKYIAAWAKANDDRKKLQQAYFVVALVSLVVASLISLVNDEIGYALLQVAFLFAVLFFANAVAWHLLTSFALPRAKKLANQRKK